MKQILTFLTLFVMVVALSNCGSYNVEKQIEGTWTWTYAVDGDGNDLMGTYDYKTATFSSDGTYEFDIGNHPHNGTYEVISDEDILRLDGTADWKILEISKSKLQLKKDEDNGYEWHFEK